MPPGSGSAWGWRLARADMMQAVLEGIALLAAELIAAMDRATPLTGAVSIDGGLSKNRLFLRFPGRARCSARCSVPSSADLTGLGTAQMAMIGAGLATPETLPPGARPPPPRRSRRSARSSRPCALHRGHRPLPQLAVTWVPC